MPRPSDDKTLADIEAVRDYITQDRAPRMDRPTITRGAALSALDSLVAELEAAEERAITNSYAALEASTHIAAVEKERDDWKRRWETELAMHGETDKAAVYLEERLWALRLEFIQRGSLGASPADIAMWLRMAAAALASGRRNG